LHKNANIVSNFLAKCGFLSRKSACGSAALDDLGTHTTKATNSGYQYESAYEQFPDETLTKNRDPNLVQWKNMLREFHYERTVRGNNTTNTVYRLHTAILNRPLSNAATKEV
jgi:hypothetical protein